MKSRVPIGCPNASLATPSTIPDPELRLPGRSTRLYLDSFRPSANALCSCAPLDRNVIMSSEHLSRKTGSVASDNAKDLPVPRKEWPVHEDLPTGETVFICIDILHCFISW
ncbi:hypothetical protein V6N12_015604 [Hibiscus sabdariffa]|uniref:Uncharacterized protein n=1 Tax=Hibiscus sabdariffa TaxID=183260 RepID=A0ABR2DRM2_9ROSI